MAEMAEKSSMEARVYAAADRLFLDCGALDAVTLADVVRQTGGRRQRVAYLLRRWYDDRTMLANLPEPAVRAAHRFTRDLFLILTLTRPRSPALVPEFAPTPAPRKVARDGSAEGAPMVQVADAPRHPAPALGNAASSPAVESTSRRGFLQGYQERRAVKQPTPVANVRPADAPPRGRTRADRTAAPPPRAPSLLDAADAADAVGERARRLSNMRKYVLSEEAERSLLPPFPVFECDWQGAAQPQVARAVAIELRAAWRPLTAKALIDTDRVPLMIKRSQLEAALVGSRITKVAGAGGYWFKNEPPPRPRKPCTSADTDHKIVREFAQLLESRAIVAIVGSATPLDRGAIAASLQPEISNLSPAWLDQWLARMKKARALVMCRGGYVVARP